MEGCLFHELKQYATLYNPDIPDYVFLNSFWITSALIAILLIIKKDLNIKRTVIGILFVECIFIIFCSTVVYRETLPEARSNFIPFWNYQAIRRGDDRCFVEVLLNVILFIPIGFLACGLRRINKWWKVALVGAVISCTIEGLQLWLQKGFCELDDVFHNTLGAIVGYKLYQWIALLLKRNMMKHKNKQNQKI